MSLYIDMDAIESSVCLFKLKQIIIDNIDILVMDNLHSEIDPDTLYSLLDNDDKLSCEEYMTDHSEHTVSVLFDQYINELNIVSTLQQARDYLEDSIAINEDFNNFVDSLHSDDQLGNQQVNQYCYVGEYAKD